MKEGQACCNLDNGGKGGCHFVWTNEMRNYKSKYNPMKDKKQRERMSSKNPMRNKETAKKVGIKHGRAVIINDVRYYGLIEASRILKKCEPTIRDWCKRGYDSWGNPCRYEDEPQKKVSNLRKLHPLSTRHKAVIVDGKFFTTVMDGASYLKITPQQFVYFLKQNRSPKGHKCEYANQQPS